MKTKSKEHITLSSRNFGIIVCILILLLTFVIFNIAAQKTIPVPQFTVHINKPTTIPTATIDPNKQGFHGYDDRKAWYNLALPPECILGKNEKLFFDEAKIITCKTNTFTIIINPQAGGRDAKVIERREVVLNSNIWTKYELDNDHQYSATYGLNDKANTYLIGVRYEPFTPEAKHYFETILASFHFIE